MDTGGCIVPYTQGPVNNKIDRWLVDTGCGYDLVSQEHAASMKRWVRKAVRPRSFQTATGITTTDKVARMTVGEFVEEVAPDILGSTPAVLSVGYRCMNLGYSFIWPKGRQPILLAARRQGMPSGHEGRRSVPLPWNCTKQAERVDEDKMLRLHMRRDLDAPLR